MNRVRGRTLHEPGGQNTHLQVFVTEEEKIDRVGDTAPTIDSILIGEFTDYEKRREWLQANAPAFLSDPA